MKCPECGFHDDKVVDSRTTKEGEAIRRRRECLQCNKRYTTYEYIERVPLVVVKKGGQREQYNREKLLSGLLRACEKRPVSREQIDQLLDEVEAVIFGKFKTEVKSHDLGNEVIDRLHALDEVAYVRFASVYRQFKDINQFMKEVKLLLDQQGDDTNGGSKR
jgi:transcriptional repressor NrdR